MTAQTHDSSESSSSVHSALLRQVREHDAQAWGRLVRIYGPLVYQWCRSQKLQASDAADVMQEVFQSVAANIDRIRAVLVPASGPTVKPVPKPRLPSKAMPIPKATPQSAGSRQRSLSGTGSP